MPLSTDFSNKSAACGVRAESSVITGTLTALALPLSPPPSPLDSCSVIRGPGSRAARKAWWNRVWSGENRVSRESNCSFHRLFCIRCIRVFFLFLFFFFLVGRGRKVSRDWYFDDNVSVPLNPTRKDSSLLLAEYPLTQEEIASRNFRAFTGSF